MGTFGLMIGLVGCGPFGFPRATPPPLATPPPTFAIPPGNCFMPGGQGEGLCALGRGGGLQGLPVGPKNPPGGAPAAPPAAPPPVAPVIELNGFCPGTGGAAA